ncbi:exosome complex component RRP45, partial [Lecanoromycetidae sp. Uapishka_2]
MPREAEPSINERAFILQALHEDVRLDGRALDAFRDLDIFFGDQYGVADVRLGKTRVLTRISASITAPYPDRKFDGVFTITTELSPIASPAFEVGRQSDLETHLSRILETSLRRSQALSTESLCLVAGQKVWSLRADIHILDHDGNLIDAACLATLAALRHYRIPDTQIKGGELTVFTLLERDPIPLALLHHPLCVTLNYFESGEKMLVDATLVEQQCSEGEVVVAANPQGEVCLVQKGGGGQVDALMLLRCVEMAVGKVKELGKRVDSALEADAKKRDKGGISRELQAENER